VRYSKWMHATRISGTKRTSFEALDAAPLQYQKSKVKCQKSKVKSQMSKVKSRHSAQAAGTCFLGSRSLLFLPTILLQKIRDVSHKANGNMLLHRWATEAFELEGQLRVAWKQQENGSGVWECVWRQELEAQKQVGKSKQVKEEGAGLIVNDEICQPPEEAYVSDARRQEKKTCAYDVEARAPLLSAFGDGGVGPLGHAVHSCKERGS
jgi:hypothetical protein